MDKEALLSSNTRRQLLFMLEPMRGSGLLPLRPEEKARTLEAARDWLDRFLVLLGNTRETLLARVLNPGVTPAQAETSFLHPSGLPIPGWDWQSPEAAILQSPVENLFDPENMERAGFLVGQLTKSAEEPFYQEMALLTVDRLDLLISIIRAERQRFEP